MSQPQLQPGHQDRVRILEIATEVLFRSFDPIPSSGLWQPFQPATTNQAAADYFAGLPQAVADGGTARGIRQVTGGFPTAGVDDDLVRAARSLAADLDLPAAVRTVLADQADVAARMLRTGRRPS